MGARVANGSASANSGGADPWDHPLDPQDGASCCPLGLAPCSKKVHCSVKVTDYRKGIVSFYTTRKRNKISYCKNNIVCNIPHSYSAGYQVGGNAWVSVGVLVCMAAHAHSPLEIRSWFLRCHQHYF